MAITNKSDYNLAALGQAGTYVLTSANPFYSSALEKQGILAITATGDQITYKLAGSPDLSKVIEGAAAVITGLGNAANNGQKIIVSANNTTKDIVVDNAGVDGVADASPRSAAGISVKGRTAIAFRVNSDLTIGTITERNSYGAEPSTLTYTAGDEVLGDFEEITVTAGEARVFFGTEWIHPSER